MSVEITQTNQAIELSKRELDAVAGGGDSATNATDFQERISALNLQTVSTKDGSFATTQSFKDVVNTGAFSTVHLG